MLEDVRRALRIKTNDFDSEIEKKIAAAKKDLQIAGVTMLDDTDPLILEAVITYCKAHFGEPDKYEDFKKSYDEQKAQLQTATGYTTWS